MNITQKNENGKKKKKVQDPKGIIKTLLVYFGNG
jgi:hypothetical protein